MVVRDADVLAAMGEVVGCTVYMSVPIVDERRLARAGAGNRASASAASRRSPAAAMPASTPAC